MTARLTFNTPLGAMLALADDVGLRLLDFADRKGLDDAAARVQRTAGASGETARSILHRTREQIERYFAGSSAEFELPLAPVGTAFQQLVWASLRTIPPGQTRSYAEQTRLIASPTAIRAVAQANGRNFIAIIIPCHRVIATTGALTGYGGGIERKRWLLAHEGALAAATDG